MNLSKRLASLFVVLSAVSGSALAAVESTELIVRYREPQNDLFMANFTTMTLTEQSSADAEIVNSEEGVVKLRFATAEQAEAALAKLSQSDAVLSVGRNNYYRPALKLEMKKAEQASISTFLGLPFAGLAIRPDAKDLPEVKLPTGQVTLGADPLEVKDWAMAKIRMPKKSTDIAYKDRVVLAVTDTGIDYNHEDMIETMWRAGNNPREVGYDFAQMNDRPFDVVHFDIEGCLKDFGCSMGIGQENFLVNPGHGTHVAGRAGAVANNSLGIRGTGVVKLMALKFFYDHGHEHAGQGDDAGAIASIDYAIKNGAKVVNASWGGRMPRKDAEKAELKQAFVRAQKAGVLVVVAAGNDGINQDSDKQPSYPAAYNLDNLVVVAATNRLDQLADFSNFGKKSVHIAAPGVRILSTTSGNNYSDLVAKFKDQQGQERELEWSGTSMASPIVAGAAAAIWAKYPNENYKQIRARLLSSVRKIPGLTGKVSTGGVLDVTAALK